VFREAPGFLHGAQSHIEGLVTVFALLGGDQNLLAAKRTRFVIN
jgi:hypothetical protein